MATVAELEILINANTAGAERGIALVQDKLFRFAIGMGGVGAITAGAFTGFLSSAIDMETAMQNINSIAQVNQETLAGWTDRIQELGAAFGEDPVVLAQGMYEIQSAGFAASDALDILASSAKAARAGLSDTGTASDAVTSIMNSFAGTLDTVSNGYTQLATEGERAEYVQNVLFRAVDRGKMTYDELAGSVGRVAAVSATAGLTIEDIGASFAVMTQQGLNADEAATSLFNTVNALIKPNKAMVAVLEEHGYASGQAAIADLGFVGVMEMMEEATGGNADAIAELFSNIRGQRGATLLMNSDLAAMVDLMLGAQPVINETTGEIEQMGAMDLALSQQMDTASFAIDRFRSALTSFGQDITSQFLGPIQTVMNFLADLLVSFIKLSGPVKDFAGLFLGLVAAFTTGAAAIAIFLAIMAPVVSVIAGVLAAIIAVSAAIAGLVTLFRALSDTAPFQRAMSDIRNWFSDLLSPITNAITAVREMWSALGEADVNIVSRISLTIGKFFNTLAENIPFFDSLSSIFSKVGDFFVDFGLAVHRGAQVFEEYANALKSVAITYKTLWGTFTLNKTTKMFDDIQVIARGVQAVLRELEATFPRFAAFFDNLFAAFMGFLNAFRSASVGEWSDAWNFFLRGISESIDAIGDLGEELYAELVEWFDSVDWAGVAGFLGDLLMDAIDLALDLATSAIDFVSDAIDWVMDVAAPTVIGWVAQAGNFVWDHIQSIYPTVRDWVSDAIDWTLDTAAPAVEGWFLQYGGGVWNWIKTKFGTVEGWTSDAISWVLDTGVPLLRGWIMDLATDAWGAIKGIVSTVEGWTSSAINWTLDTGVPGAIIGWIGDFAADPWGKIKSYYATVEGWTSTAINWILDTGIPGAITGWIQDFSADAWGKIKSYYATVEGWTSSAINWTLDTGVPSAIIGWIMDFASDPWSKIKSFYGTVEGWTSSAITWVLNTGIPAAIIGWIAEFAAGPWEKIKGWWAGVEGWTGNLETWSLNILEPSDVTGFFSEGGAGADLGAWVHDQWIANESFEVEVPVTIRITVTGWEWEPSLNVSLQDNVDALGIIRTELKEWAIILGIPEIDVPDNLPQLFGLAILATVFAPIIIPTIVTLRVFPTIVDWAKSLSDFLQDAVQAEGPFESDIANLTLKVITGVALFPFMGATWLKDEVEKVIDKVVEIDGLTIKILDVKIDWPESPGNALEDLIEGILGGFSQSASAEELPDGTISFEGTAQAIAAAIDAAAAMAITNLGSSAIPAAIELHMAEQMQAAAGTITAGPSSQMIAESIDRAVSTQLGTFTGASLGNAIQQWVARGLQTAPINAGPSSQAMLVKLDQAVSAQLATFSGASLGVAIQQWVARGLQAAPIAAGPSFTGLAEKINTELTAAIVVIDPTILGTAIYAWIVSALAYAQAQALPIAQVLADALGNHFGQNLALGMQDQIGTIFNAGNSLCLAAQQGFNSQAASRAQTSGQAFGRTVANAITGMTGQAHSAGRSLAIAAGQGVTSVSGYASGAAWAQGAINGVYGMVGAAYSAGAALGLAVNQGFNATLSITSPSKVGMKSGSYYSQGVILGVESLLDRATMAGQRIAEAVSQPMLRPSEYGMQNFAQRVDATGRAIAMAPGRGGQVVNNYFVVTPEELERMMRESREGSDFARRFGFESGAKLASMHN